MVLSGCPSQSRSAAERQSRGAGRTAPVHMPSTPSLHELVPRRQLPMSFTPQGTSWEHPQPPGGAFGVPSQLASSPGTQVSTAVGWMLQAPHCKSASQPCWPSAQSPSESTHGRTSPAEHWPQLPMVGTQTADPLHGACGTHALPVSSHRSGTPAPLHSACPLRHTPQVAVEGTQKGVSPPQGARRCHCPSSEQVRGVSPSQPVLPGKHCTQPPAKHCAVASQAGPGT
jgi:hypothetical protein